MQPLLTSVTGLQTGCDQVKRCPDSNAIMASQAPPDQQQHAVTQVSPQSPMKNTGKNMTRQVFPMRMQTAGLCLIGGSRPPQLAHCTPSHVQLQ